MKKAGLMSTIATSLGTLETIMVESTKAIDTLSSYNTNWSESRELDLAKARFERDIEWMHLGKAVLSTQFDEEAVNAAKARYLDNK